MNWFKTLWLTSEERKLLKLAKEQSLVPINTEVPVTRPYKKLLYVNGNITIILNDDSILSKGNVTREDFELVRLAQSSDEISKILSYTLEKQDGKDLQLVKDNLSIFRLFPEFQIRGKSVYLKNVSLEMPEPVVASFIELLEKLTDAKAKQNVKVQDECENNLTALKMFWLKLALNSIQSSRNDLLTFVYKNDVRITRNGNLILYRRVVSKEGADKKLVAFITQNYYQVKKDGLDPRNFAIAKVGDDYTLLNLEKLEEGNPEPFMNLQVGYLELPTFDTNQFTAAHDRTVEIKLGGIYKIPENMINLDNGICAAGGLHAAAVDYDYRGFGDLPVVVLVNPSKAITVPRSETGKLRTTEMFVACVNDKQHGVHFDESSLAAFDEEYHDMTLSELEEVVKTKSFAPLSVKDQIPAVSSLDIKAIKEMLKNRIVTV